MGRVDLQVDWLSVDPFIVSCYSCSLRFDFTLDLGEVIESAPGDMMELAPFLLPRYARWCVGDVNFVAIWLVVAVAGQVDELQDERPASDDAAPSGEEVSTDDVL
jgi:hypothetical protein